MELNQHLPSLQVVALALAVGSLVLALIILRASRCCAAILLVVCLGGAIHFFATSQPRLTLAGVTWPQVDWRVWSGALASGAIVGLWAHGLARIVMAALILAVIAAAALGAATHSDRPIPEYLQDLGRRLISIATSIAQSAIPWRAAVVFALAGLLLGVVGDAALHRLD